MGVDAFIGWFVETSLAVSLLIIGVLMIRRPVARRFGPEAAYLLWLAPALRLVTPELAILPASWKPAAQSSDTASWAIETTGAAPTVTAAIAPSPLIDWPLQLAAFWTIGAAAFFFWHLLAQRRFMRRIEADTSPPSAVVAAEAAVIADRAGLPRAPRLLVAKDGAGPLVAGIFKPTIVLPADFEASYTSVERQLALSHECAHIRRGDLAAGLVALAFRAAQWLNPLAHLAFRAYRIDQEAACDASVIAGNRNFPDVSYVYGAAIMKAASGARKAPSASLAMSNHLKERLMLMKSGMKSSTGAARALAAALVVSGLAATAGYAYAAEKSGKHEKTIVKKQHRAVSVSVISADDDEILKIDGVKDARKIEIRTEDGKRIVKMWDKNGKLVSEKTYAADDKMPFEEITLIDGKGKAKMIDILSLPEHPTAPMSPEWADADGDRRIMIFSSQDGHPTEIDCSGDDGEIVEMATAGDGKREIRKEIICIGAVGEGGDPASRAEALRRAIDHMEAEAKRRDIALAKLREQLAAAEKDAKKK